MKRWYFLLMLAATIMVSCQKELSLETGNLPGDSTVAPTPNTCKLATLNETDIATGVSTYSYISSFDTEHKVARLDVVDSSISTILGRFPITYTSNRIQLGTDQYFVTAADGRVTEFHGFEDPENRLGKKISSKYTYNAAGQLSLRTVTYDSLPAVVALQMKFTWAGGNLTRQTVEFFNGASYTVYGQADYSYDASKTVRNFINLYAASFELVTFQMVVNSGINNVNPVSKIVVVITDPVTLSKTTTTSNFTSYAIDSKNYVQSFQVTGDDFNRGGLYAGRKYVLSYTCY